MGCAIGLISKKINFKDYAQSVVAVILELTNIANM